MHLQNAPFKEGELLANFGNFTTESVWLDEELQGITVYCGIVDITVLQAYLNMYHQGHRPVFLVSTVAAQNSSQSMDLMKW